MSRFIGIKIIVEDNNAEYHTLNDWGLYIQNTDYIGEPLQVKNLVYVPGREGYIDLSKTIEGHITYSSRLISVTLSGFADKHNWDPAISKLRNEISGRTCRFIFDNDKSYFWRGRVTIKDFSSILRVGSLKIEMPEAEPYKYSVQTSAEPWLWDPFNFETGIITYIATITVNGTSTVTIPKGYMPVCPVFTVTNKTGTLKVAYKGTEYELNSGLNKIPSIFVGGDNNIQLTFTGTAKVQITYRSGSL